MKNPYYGDDISELLSLTDGIVLTSLKMSDLAVEFLMAITGSPELSQRTLIAMWDTAVLETLENLPTSIRPYFHQAMDTLFIALIERLFPLISEEVALLFTATRVVVCRTGV